jgi:hypothetical protein
MRIQGLILSMLLGLAGAAHATPPAPPAFVGIKATGVTAQLVLTWTAVANNPPVTTYVVYYSTDANGIADSSFNSLTVDAAFRNATISVQPMATDGDFVYAWVASAEGLDGEGTTVTAATWTDPDVQWPYTAASAPLGLTATVLPFGGGLSLQFTQPAWDGDAEQGGTEILAGGPGNALTTVLVVDAGVTSAAMSADLLGCGTGLTLVARAVDVWGDPGLESAPVKVSPPCAVKLSVTSLSGFGVVGVSWSAATGAIGCQLYQSTLPQDPAPSLAVSTGGTAKGTTTLAEAMGTPLYLRAAWIGPGSVVSPLSNEIQVLPPPQNLAVIPYTAAALLQWQGDIQPNMPITAYAVYCSPVAGVAIDANTDTPYAYVFAPAQTSATVSAVVHGLTAGPLSSYSFAVAAITGGAHWWTGTASASVAAGANMAFPTISEVQSLTQSAGANWLQLNWLPSQDYEGSTVTAVSSNSTVTYNLFAVSAPAATTDSNQGFTRWVATTTTASAIDVSRSSSAAQYWYYVTVSVTGQAAGSSLVSPTASTAKGMVDVPVLDSPVLNSAAPVAGANGRIQLSWTTVNNADLYQVLRSTGGAPFSPLPDGLLLALTVSGQSQSWVDADAVNNTGNAYEVEALQTLQAGVAGPALPSAASAPLSAVLGVGPGLPGPWYRNGVSANSSVFQTVGGNAITAVASANIGQVDLVWAPAGAGSSRITGYAVRRGNTPDPTAMQDVTIVAVDATMAASNALVRYTDGPGSGIQEPRSALWYAVRSLAQDNSVSNWVTGTVSATALPWGPPTLTLYSSRVGGVTLGIGASTSPGTYGTPDQLTYTVLRCDQGPFLFGLGGLAVPVTQFAMVSITFNAFTGLTMPVFVTSTAYTDTTVDPNLGNAPYYYVTVKEPVTGQDSLPAAVLANLALPQSWVTAPAAVSGLAGTVGAAVGGTTTGSAAVLGPTVNLKWFANSAAQGTSSPGLPVFLDYQLWLGGIGGTPVLVSPATGSATISQTDNSLTSSGSAWGGTAKYVIRAGNAKGFGPYGITGTVSGVSNTPLPITVTVALLPPPADGVGLAPLISTATTSAVTLTWDTQTATAAVGYQVLRFHGSSNSLVADASPLTTTGQSINTYTDNPLTGTAVGYAVGVVVNNGTTNVGSWDLGTALAVTQVSLTVEPVPSSIPAPPTLVPSVDRVQVSWQPAPGASAYWIYRSSYAPSGSLPDNALVASNVPCCGWTDPAAPGQVTSYYSVAGVNATTIGPYVSNNTTAQQGPPLRLTAQPSWDYGSNTPEAILEWSPPAAASDATGYNVYRDVVPTVPSPSTTPLATVSTTNFTDEPLPLTATAYYYFVQGYFNGNTSTVATTTAATAYQPLGPVSGLSAVGRGAGIFAQWTPLAPSTGVDSYLLSVSLGAAAVVSVTVQANPDSQSTQATGYIPLSGTALRGTLSVQIAGHNSASYGQGLASPVTVAANSAVNGQLVQGVTGTVGFYETVTGAARVALSFATPTSGVTLIYRNLGAPVLVTQAAGGAASVGSFLAEADGVDSYVDTTVAVGPSAIYYYAFTSLNKVGLPGGESPPVLLGPLKPYVAPGPCAISGTAGNGRVDLVFSPPATWGTNGAPPSVTCTAFLLYRVGTTATASAPVGPSFTTACDPGFPVALTLGANTYTDTAVINGYAYNYFLKAVDGAGLASDQWAFPHLAAPYAGDIAPMVPLATQPPPVQLTAVAGDNSVTLRWVASQADADTSAFGGTGATYNVYRRLTVTGSAGDYGPNSLLPWLQHVGPVAQDYAGGSTQNGLLVETLSDPPAGVTSPGAPGAPVNQTGYCYSITTVNSRGESPKGPEVCAVPYKPLAAPTGVMVSSTAGANKNLWIGWLDIPGTTPAGSYPITGYEVFRSSDGGTTFKVVAVTGKTANACTDTATAFGAAYLYRVAAIDQAGNLGDSSALVPGVIPTGSDAIHLYRNAFDPSKGQTCGVQYSVEQPGHVWIKVFTLSGEYVTTLFDENVPMASKASPYLSTRVNWPGTNAQGQTVASGVYLVHLEGPSFRANARVAVIK